MKKYRNELRQLHREGGPAIKDSDGKFWYINGKRHREGGPAIEWSDGHKSWYINGKLHREDGPAREYKNGTKFWYLNDIRYTEDQYYHELDKINLERFYERLKEDPESRELKQEIKKLEAKLTSHKFGL